MTEKIVNIEKFNEDQKKKWDEHNDNVIKAAGDEAFKDTERHSLDVFETVSRGKTSFTIPWKDGQYEEIFCKKGESGK